MRPSLFSLLLLAGCASPQYVQTSPYCPMGSTGDDCPPPAKNDTFISRLANSPMGGAIMGAAAENNTLRQQQEGDERASRISAQEVQDAIKREPLRQYGCRANGYRYCY